MTDSSAKANRSEVMRASTRGYGGWPDRIVVIDADGKVAYPCRRGPVGFKPSQAETMLKAVKTTKTANWDEFKSFPVGRIEIKEPGVYVVKVRAKDAATWKPMGLAWISMKPVK